MTAESYLNHPTFGLLYRICHLDDNQELFTTLYAQRMFFLVTNSEEGIAFQPITRADSRMMMDNRMRVLRRDGNLAEFGKLQAIHKQTFS